MTLKFGLIFGIRNPERWHKPWPQVHSEMIEQLQAAEELGFDSVWLSEHVRSFSAFGVCWPVAFGIQDHSSGRYYTVALITLLSFFS